ncbi:MAG: GtrA family protein [Acidobacteriaceae bacterium]|nr:GtrA family protein [Acidobacteriaceae bacterium]
MLATSAPYIAVMDADLQHDEPVLPEMLALLKRERYDLVVGSRNVEGGSMGNFASKRVLLSRMGATLSDLVCRCNLSDPMSGFFVVDRRFFEEVMHRLSGRGFKILVDLVGSAQRPVRFGEVPYHFRSRESGQSKLDLNVSMEYVALLLDKLLGDFVPVRFLLFALVGAMGLALHLSTLALIHYGLRHSFVEAQVAATFAAMTLNFLLNNLITFRDRRLRGAQIITGLLTFYAACSIGALAGVSLAKALVNEGLYWPLAGAVGMVISSVWNYTVNEIFTWRRVRRSTSRKAPQPDAPMPATELVNLLTFATHEPLRSPHTGLLPPDRTHTFPAHVPLNR